MSTEPPKRPVGSGQFQDLRPRLISALVLGGIAFIALALGGIWSALLVLALLLAMLWEYERMVSAPGDDAWAWPVLLWLGGAGAVVATGLASLGGGLLVLLALSVLAGEVRRPRARLLAPGAIYMGVAMCALLDLRLRHEDGFILILWLVMVVVAADVGAYFAGRRFGGRKLWPAVSPGKTWSGAFGGLLLAAVMGVIFAAALSSGWPVFRVTLVSIAVAIGSQAGDLLESAVKRRFGVKDSSQLIPGHGGVMDRLDGIMGGTLAFLLLDMIGLGLPGG